jgi:hypothetical protein
MPGVDASIVFLPRFTALVGAADFATAPLAVSEQGGAQFQVWRGPIRTASGPGTFTLYLEESLDAQTWALGPSAAQAITVAENSPLFLSYSFRLRWFRLRVTLGGSSPMVSCWAEGLLRGGEGPMWGSPVLAGTAAGQLGPGEVRPAMGNGQSLLDLAQRQEWNRIQSMWWSGIRLLDPVAGSPWAGPPPFVGGPGGGGPIPGWGANLGLDYLQAAPGQIVPVQKGP